MALFGGMGNESTKTYTQEWTEMFRWPLQIDIDSAAMDRGYFLGKRHEVKFRFKLFNCTAWATLVKLPPSDIGLQVGLKTLNSEGAGSKLLPWERLSLNVETPVGTKLFEGGPGIFEFDEVHQDMFRASRVIKMTQETFDELQMHGRGVILIFILNTTKISTTTQKIYWPSEMYIKEKFYKMIRKLENNEKKSDLKIISSDGKEFFAYSWILAEVSGVFEAMFRSDTKEKESGVLKMDDMSGTTVKTMLHFIYSGEVAKEWSETAVELMYAADKYQIGELKTYLDAKLGMICTADNAGALLAMAEKTSLKRAVADILAFIRKQCKDPKGFFEIVKKTKTD